MPAALGALDYLAHPQRHPASALSVVHGDEPFLKRLAVDEIRRQVLGTGDGEFCESSFAGDAAEWRDVADALASAGLFGSGRRLVVVDDADPFVTANRKRLEEYVDRDRSSGVLLLIVDSWPANTRLYKAVAADGLTIECKSPGPAKLLKWIVDWARARHDCRLGHAAAEQLLEIVPAELGLLDQQLAKLAAYAGPGVEVTARMVTDLVGGWRTKTTWEMIDAALAGDAAAALAQLEQLILAGEQPIALLGQMGSSLRRFAAATRLVLDDETAGRRPSLREALRRAGIKPFVLDKAESQLRQLGRHRAAGLYRLVLAADLELKGASSQPPQMVLEQLIVRLSREAGAPTSRLRAAAR